MYSYKNALLFLPPPPTPRITLCYLGKATNIYLLFESVYDIITTNAQNPK